MIVAMIVMMMMKMMMMAVMVVVVISVIVYISVSHCYTPVTLTKMDVMKVEEPSM